MEGITRETVPVISKNLDVNYFAIKTPAWLDVGPSVSIFRRVPSQVEESDAPLVKSGRPMTSHVRITAAQCRELAA
jgi:hypothetical protein